MRKGLEKMAETNPGLARIIGASTIEKADEAVRFSLMRIQPDPEHEAEDQRLLDLLAQAYPNGFLPEQGLEWKREARKEAAEIMTRQAVPNEYKHETDKRKLQEQHMHNMGSVDHRAFLAWLRSTGLKPGDTFWDLGSGHGELVVLAALYGLDAVGLEFMPSRVRVSCRALKNLNASGWRPESSCSSGAGGDVCDGGETGRAGARFYQGFIEDFDYSDADAVFAFSLSYRPKDLENIAHRAGNMKRMSKLLVGSDISGPGLDETRVQIKTDRSPDGLFHSVIVRHRRHKPAAPLNRKARCQL